ncbi:FISUMP domain-containing protein [Elizabethkingia miricola]|uniref:FISUMP domain-containing protein n=1 Tax=Elizabethkingia miricola TaxID=172045 RepID=UPI0038923EB7
MKTNKKSITGMGLVSFLLLMSSCRTADSDNNLGASGPVAVNINLLGTEFSETESNAPQASIGTGSIISTNGLEQSRSVLINPSTVLVVKLSTDTSLNTSASINPVAAIPGDPLTSGIKFRIIAYKQSDGAYYTHQDYTIGIAPVPLMLDNNTPYNMVVYSYGATSLPAISVGEKANISTAQVNYDNANRDFMYYQQGFTPVNPGGTNTFNITLHHKLAQITTKILSGSLGPIQSIANASITPHYTNGIISLSSGNMSGRTTLSNAQVAFPGAFPGSTQTATPVLVNADTGGLTTGSFSADIKIGGVTNTINVPNAFAIRPGWKRNLNITLAKKCGAYVASGVWKDFMCHNLGADTSKDPFTPSASIMGALYEWGKSTPEITQANDQIVGTGTASPWNTILPSDNAWLDASKTANDPCPSGYRVPTKAQWQGLAANNTLNYVGSWNRLYPNFDSGIEVSSAGNGVTLFLPANTGRYGTTGNKIPPASGPFTYGTFMETSRQGNYWASGSNAPGYGQQHRFYNGGQIATNTAYLYGLSVRCVAE